MSLASRFEEILKRIQAATPGRKPGRDITLIAVSKTQPPETIEALYRLGHRDFGESYVQELTTKAAALEERGCSGIRWHFIGHLQTNKVKQLLPRIHAVHALDSERLARELAKRWIALGRAEKLPVFVEVNIDQEEEKSGVPPEEAPRLAKLVLEDPAISGALSLQGLMCIPDPEKGPSGAKAAFARLRALGRQLPDSASQLSMGMSEDFEIALSEGATHIRVGTAIFGARI